MAAMMAALGRSFAHSETKIGTPPPTKYLRSVFSSWLSLLE